MGRQPVVCRKGTEFRMHANAGSDVSAMLAEQALSSSGEMHHRANRNADALITSAS